MNLKDLQSVPFGVSVSLSMAGNKKSKASFSFYLGSSEPGLWRCRTPARGGSGRPLCSFWTLPPRPPSSSAHSAQWWLEIHTKPHTTQTQLLKVSVFVQEKGCLSEHRPWGRKKERKRQEVTLANTQKKTLSIAIRTHIFNYVADDAALRPCVHVRLCTWVWAWLIECVGRGNRHYGCNDTAARQLRAT